MRLISYLSLPLLLLACEPATLQAVGDPSEGPVPVKAPDGQQVGPGTEPGQDPPTSPGTEAPPPAAAPAELIVTAPPRGARVLGNTLRVQGQVIGGEAPTVKVAGMPATLKADGSFIVDVPVEDGLAVLVTEMEDGPVTSEDHRAALINADQAPNTPIPGAIGLDISAQGFQVITQLVNSFLSTADLSALLGGDVAPADVEIRQLTFGRMDLQLTPVQDALELRLQIFELFIEIETEVRVILVDIDVRGSMRANPAEITARIKMVPDGQGSMSLAIEGANVNLRDFSYNIRNVPGEIEQWFEGTVRDMAEDLLRDALNDVVLPNLFDPGSLNQEIDVLGAKILMAMGIDSVDIDPSGMHIGLTSAVVPEVAIYPGKALRPVGGVDDAVDPAQIDVALAADLVNRLLHAVWAAGLLDMEIGGENPSIELDLPLTAGLLLGALAEAGQGISPASPLIIRTRGLLPPVTTLSAGELPMHIEIGDFLLDLATAEELLVTLAVHMSVDVGLEPDETGTLVPKIVMVNHVDVADSPRGKVNANALETLIGGIMGQLPTLLLDGLAPEEGAAPMPASPINLLDPRFVAAGEFLHILADIDPNPVPAP